MGPKLEATSTPLYVIIRCPDPHGLFGVRVAYLGPSTARVRRAHELTPAESPMRLRENARNIHLVKNLPSRFVYAHFKVFSVSRSGLSSR